VRTDCSWSLVHSTCLAHRHWNWVKGCGRAFRNSGCLRKFDIFCEEQFTRRCLPSSICASGKWWLMVCVSSVVIQLKTISMRCGFAIQLSPFGCRISASPFCVLKGFPSLKICFAFYTRKFHPSWWSFFPCSHGVFGSVGIGFRKDKRCGVLMRCVPRPLSC